MSFLPRANEAVIPIEKFTKYLLTSDKNKMFAFERALGYTLKNADELIRKIRDGIKIFPATAKPDLGYGKRYEVIMTIEGENGKSAKLLTAWIDDNKTGEIRLVTAYIDN